MVKKASLKLQQILKETTQDRNEVNVDKQEHLKQKERGTYNTVNYTQATLGRNIQFI